MPKDPSTRKVTAAEARMYALKAEEYLEAAEENLENGRYNAATSLAVHAGINAADAISGARQGSRLAAKDHSRAVKFLSETGQDGAEASKQLARLIPLKTRAEYDPIRLTKTQATGAVRAARNIVEIANRVLLSLG
ncbi:MAG: HEPN domain-containing protein [Actinomycetota bacterium]|nr:HEPN domain-containing protein [Actinomycetota bacterium]